MELVTGRKGSPHITSQQNRQLHQGVFGEETYILNTGNMLETEIQSSNKIKIKDGALMFQGALFSVKVGTYDEVTINNGNKGMKRKDVIAIRYTYDSEQNVELGEWVVIQGEPSASNPVLPNVTTGSIQDGDAVAEDTVFVVNLDGINIVGIDIIPKVMPTIPELNSKLLEQKVLWTGAEYMSDKQTAALSEKMSDQKHGVVLIFSFFENDSAQNYSFVHFFVPKEFLKLHFGAGSQFTMTWNNIITEKYLYFNDGSIKGAASNVNANNKRFVMRYVIGV